MTTQNLSWYGGFVGVLWNADRKLHLIDDRSGGTFCAIRSGLRPITRREASSPSREWCHTCNERAQAVRRDLTPA